MKNTFTKERSRNIDNIMSFVRTNRFSISKDEIKEYSSRSILHYLQLDHSTYLVINHFNYKGSIDQQGFDAWKATYDRPSEIGSKLSTSIESVKISLRMPEDSDLLKSYIEGHGNSPQQ